MFRVRNRSWWLLLAALTSPALAQGLRPTAAPVPFALPCDVGQSSTARHLSRDASGVLWAVAACSGSVQVTHSDDGGATWSPAQDVSGTGVSQAAIEGGTQAGRAIVAWETFTGSVVARTTADGGASWSPAVTLMGLTSATDGLSLVAEGDWYHVMAYSATLNAPLVASSPSLGASWGPAVAWPMSWAFGDLVHDAAAGQLELVSDAPSFFRRTSGDHAATFSPVAGLPGGCCLTYSDWAVGGMRLLYGVGSSGTMWRFNLGAGMSEQAASLPNAFATQRSVDADAGGNGWTAAKEAVTGQVSLQAWRAGQPGPDPRVVLDGGGDNPSVSACDDGVAILWRRADGSIVVDRQCLDGSDTCCDADVNQPPACDAGGAHEAECGLGLPIPLDGTASQDPEGQPLAFSWSSDCPGATFDDASSPVPMLSLDGTAGCPVSCTVTLEVSDGRLATRCSVGVLVEDTTPPAVAPPAAPVSLAWPPNHRYFDVPASDLRPLVTDACGGPVAWELAGCASSQPDDSVGDGHTADDCVVSPDGSRLLVRAERQGGDPAGRTYVALVVARDACGNASLPLPGGLVHVPRDQRDQER